jgi:hypothetical protein
LGANETHFYLSKFSVYDHFRNSSTFKKQILWDIASVTRRIGERDGGRRAGESLDNQAFISLGM